MYASHKSEEVRKFHLGHLTTIQNYYDKVDGDEYRKIIMVIHNHKSLRVSCEDVRDFFKPRVLHRSPRGENWTIREIVFVQYFYPVPDLKEHFGLPRQIGLPQQM